MEAVTVKENTRKDQVPCPCCNRTSTVNSVISMKTLGNNVVYRKFCKECLIEFTKKGTIVPPLWE